MTCECGDTSRDTCPRCERRIDHLQDQRDHPAGDHADAAERRYETYLMGDAA